MTDVWPCLCQTGFVGACVLAFAYCSFTPAQSVAAFFRYSSDVITNDVITNDVITNDVITNDVITHDSLVKVIIILGLLFLTCPFPPKKKM